MSNPHREEKGITFDMLVNDANVLLTAAWRELDNTNGDHQVGRDFIELAREHRALAESLNTRFTASTLVAESRERSEKTELEIRELRARARGREDERRARK